MHFCKTIKHLNLANSHENINNALAQNDLQVAATKEKKIKYVGSSFSKSAKMLWIFKGEEWLLQSCSTPGNIWVYIFNNLLVQLYKNLWYIFNPL